METVGVTAQLQDGAASRWFLRPRLRSGARLRLVCLAHAGGGAGMFHPWAEPLPEAVELCAVQLPGRESRLREPPLLRLTTIVDLLATALVPLLDRPVAFFGHSMGAMIAFELARELRRRGLRQPVRLFLSGRQAPDDPQPHPALHTLDDRGFVAAVIRRYGGIPQVILDDADLLRVFLPAMRADFEVIETYLFRPGAPLDCPFTLYCGEDDDQTRPDRIAGWAGLTTRSTALRRFPGGHFYLVDNRRAVLASLSADLDAELAGLP